MGGQQGAMFAAGLLSSYGQAFGQKQKEEKDNQEREREGALRILDLAAHNPDLNPEDYPVLIRKMLEVHGAKGKDIERHVNAVSALFQPGTTDRPSQFNQPTKRVNGASLYDTTPTETVGSGAGAIPIEAPPEMNYTPAQRTAAVRFLSPQETSQRGIQEKVDEESALLPVLQRQNEIRTAGQVAVEREKAKGRAAQLNVSLQSKLQLLDKKQQFELTKKKDALAQSFQAAHPDISPEQAEELAAQQILDEASSKVELRRQQIAAIPQRIQLMKDRNDIARERLTYDMSKPQASLFNANTVELRGELANIRSQISQIELGKLTGKIEDDKTDDPDAIWPSAQKSTADKLLSQLEDRQEKVIEALGREREKVKQRTSGSPTAQSNPVPQVSAPKSNYAGRRMNMTQLQKYAQDKHLTIDQARQQVQAAGVTIH